MHRVLAIIGMHRSGTSLLARYLFESGLFLGNDLLGAHESNPAGHYEDKDFLGFHNAILVAHGLNYKVSSPVQWNIGPAIRGQAQAFIDARSNLKQWGWKDPRTCLFLPFWKSLLPDCHFMITYRPYAAVVRSLISRDILMYLDRTSRLDRMRKHRYGQDEIKQLCNDYLRVWIWYNGEIVRHLLEDPSVSYSFISFDQLIRGEFGNIDALRNLGFDLRPPQTFNTRLTRSQTTQDVSLVFDDELIREANAIEARFMRIQSPMQKTH